MRNTITETTRLLLQGNLTKEEADKILLDLHGFKQSGDIQKKIVETLRKSINIIYSKGSCGEFGHSFKAIDANSFNDVADELIKHFRKQ